MAEMSPEDTGPETIHLLNRFRGGDREALNRLYERYLDRLHAVVRLRTGPKLRAKMESLDIVQDAFLASLRDLDNFTYRSEGDFFHWICKVAENRIRDQVEHFTAGKRDVARERPLEVQRPSVQSFFGPISELATSTSPATKVVRAEDVQRLEQAIDTLPEDQREALLLVRYEQLGLAEAADIMKKTRDAVRMLVARSIVALSKSLDTGH